MCSCGAAAAASPFPGERKGVRESRVTHRRVVLGVIKSIITTRCWSGAELRRHEHCVCLCDKCCCQQRILMRILPGWDLHTAISFLPVYSGKPGLVLVVISPLVSDGWQGRSATL